MLDEKSPEETIKFKATEDVIPTEESAEEFIPVHEECRSDTPEEHDEENGAEENADQIPQRQLAHPHVANEVRIEKIISNINILGPLTCSRASHLTFVGTLLSSLSQSPLR